MMCQQALGKLQPKNYVGQECIYDAPASTREAPANTQALDLQGGGGGVLVSDCFISKTLFRRWRGCACRV